MEEIHKVITTVQQVSFKRDDAGVMNVLHDVLGRLRGELKVKSLITYIEHHEGSRVLVEALKKLPIGMEEEAEVDIGSPIVYWTPEMKMMILVMSLVCAIDLQEHEGAIEIADLLYAESLADRSESTTLHAHNTLLFLPKSIYYYALAYEKAGRLMEVRSNLLRANRYASKYHLDEAFMVTLNILLRLYCSQNQFDQAHKMLSKTSVNEGSMSNNQLARLRYYQGLIKSIQLDYSGAHGALLEAQRKAPEMGAMGFKLMVCKRLIVVTLLMGDLPLRSIFRDAAMAKPLLPYFRLSQAVRIGDLKMFKAVVEKYQKSTFEPDRTLTLILRLRHSVIKTGLRKISLAYSRISFGDICKKLHLRDDEEAEYVVCKAIRDGVIDATVDHEAQWLRAREVRDIYSTNEPQEAFHLRTQYTLKLHDEIVQKMKFHGSKEVKA